jgi:predicted Zn-dependent protease
MLLGANTSFASKPPAVISDAEIESKLKALISPLVRAANLNPDNITIRIVVDPSLNAFVANGKVMFINSGLIIKFADDPNVLYGVMAHEIAHIYAGHLVQLRGEYNNMSSMAIGGALLGLATAFAGQPDIGIFTSMAAINSAQRGMLSYSREHETEADKIAVDLLHKTHNNGQGLIKLFRFLSQRECYMNLDPYMITHPLTAERIASIQNAVKAKLGAFGDNITPQIRFDFKRMATKLESFLAQPNEVLNKYKNDEYASSIAYFRLGKLNQAVNLLDKILAKEELNPFLWELKGQYYFENSVLDKAKSFYQKALELEPSNQIIKVELAAVKINLAKDGNDKDLLNSAISLLNQSTSSQPAVAYFMLSRAYGKLGNQIKAISALSEYYFIQGSYNRSKTLADKLLKIAPENSKEYLRANDIIQFIKDSKMEK